MTTIFIEKFVPEIILTEEGSLKSYGKTKHISSN